MGALRAASSQILRRNLLDFKVHKLLPERTPIARILFNSIHINRGNVFGPVADKAYTSREERSLKEQKTKKKNILIGGLVIGGLTGALWALYSNQKKAENAKKALLTDSGAKDYLLDKPPPFFQPAKSIKNPEDRSGLKITLFQYQTCPFCCKARVFLDYFGFTYDIVEVNSVLRREVKWSKYKKVPIVVVEQGDQAIQINDSSVIVTALFSLLADSGKGELSKVMDCFPQVKWRDEETGKEMSEVQNKYFLMYNETNVDRTKEDIVEERKWRRWVDDTLVHTISPNVYRTPSEALATFRWFSKAANWENLFSWWELSLVIYVGAAAMWAISKRLKKRHNIKEDARHSLYDECNFWMKSLKKKGTPFMGGDQPNLADLAVFGVLNSMVGCQAFSDARDNTKIGIWFDLMKAAVEERQGKGMVA